MKTFTALVDLLYSSDGWTAWSVEIPELGESGYVHRIDGVEECARDILRDNSLGYSSGLVVQMARPYDPKVSNGETAVICDIDGTLAHMTDRGPFDYDKIGSDEPDEQVALLLELYQGEFDHVILLTGRDEEHREVTEDWLARYAIPYTSLIMRPLGDRRTDDIVKMELFDNHARHLDVRLVLEDRNRCVKLWRMLGLRCWQVAEGEF